MIQASDWRPSVTFATGDYVRPSPDSAAPWAFYFQATTGGTTSITPPVWPVTIGQSVPDGSVSWLCAATAPYFTQAQLEARMSRAVVKRIFDDNRDGFADLNPLMSLMLDASSYIDEAFEGIYTVPFAAPYPRSVVRLSLDAAEWLSAKRHPRLVARDWAKLKELNDADIALVRKQMRSLGKAPPDPAANTGGETDTADPDDGLGNCDPFSNTWMRPTGIF